MLTTLLSFIISFTFSIETLQVSGDTIEYEVSSLNTWDNFEDLFNKSMNLNISSGGNRSRFFQIRGIGEHSQYDNFNQSSVSYFYDGIDLSEEPQAALLTKEQSINIISNSQSIEYGSQGMGGGINLASCPIDLCDKKSITSTYQTQNTQDYILLNPFSVYKNWFVSLNFKKHLSDGFEFNEYLQKETAYQNENYYELIQNIHQSDWKVKTHSLITDQRNGYDHFSHYNNRKTQSDRPGIEKLLTQGHSLHFLRNGSEYEFSSLTSLTLTQTRQSFDEDWGNNAFWLQVLGWMSAYDYSSQNQTHRKKWHQKFKVDNGTWSLGFHFHSRFEEIHNVSFKNGEPRKQLEGQQSLLNSALYGGYKIIDSTYHQWTPEFRVEKQSLDFQGLESNHDSNILWALRSRNEITLSENLKSEVILGRSFRGGGYNLQNQNLGDRLKFQPETLYSGEFHLKRNLLLTPQSLQLFYHYRENQQLRTSFQDDPSDPSSFSTITQNAGSSYAFGFEVSQILNWRWSHSSFHFGYLFSEFRNYRDLNRNLKGRQTSYSPRYSFRIDQSFKLTQKWNFLLSFYGKDAFYFSNNHDQKSKNYELLDLSLNGQWGHWSLSFFGKNIFDKNYSQRGFYFSNEPPDWEEKLYTQPAPPLTFGTSLSYVF